MHLTYAFGCKFREIRTIITTCPLVDLAAYHCRSLQQLAPEGGLAAARRLQIVVYRPSLAHQTPYTLFILRSFLFEKLASHSLGIKVLKADDMREALVKCLIVEVMRGVPRRPVEKRDKGIIQLFSPQYSGAPVIR